MPLDRFIREANSPWHDNRLNWSTDLCSTLGPVIVGLLWVNHFLDACRRHDFGYRNFGQKAVDSKRLEVTEARRAFVDKVFRADMLKVCAQRSWWQRSDCVATALRFYDGVHFMWLGREAFYGPGGF
ncbi:MAG: phospholipase [Actinobacteria bacterium]|nr:phospholipase [Actinomycetota bacterium]